MSKILFVEDDSLMSEMYQLLLRNSEHQIEFLNDGASAIVRAKEWQPDMLLLDMMMPKMNGLEVLGALKADQATVWIPVVMLSNLDSEKFVKEALEKGAAGYVLKSDYSGAKIRTMIDDTLRRYRNELKGAVI